MLRIEIPSCALWDEKNEEFVYTKGQTLQLEHSLISLAKWEAKWQKPFLSKQAKTMEETVDYIRCMTLSQNVDPNIYNFLTTDNLEEIFHYIESPQTATYIRDSQNRRGGRGEIVTSELIYYWMVAFGIPFECQKWHLNRLLTLIRVCERKNQPSKKRSMRDVMRQNSSLNASRRAKLHSKG